MVKRVIALILFTFILTSCSIQKDPVKNSDSDVVTFPKDVSDDITESLLKETSDGTTEPKYPDTKESRMPISDIPENSDDELNYVTDISSINGKKICIDAGHGNFEKGYNEAIGPGSAQTKPAFVSGTSGAYQTEAEFNLLLAIELKGILEAQGAVVYMTRTTERAELSNIGRAQFANDLECDMVVRIHADGSENTFVSGISVLIPGKNSFVTDEGLLKTSHDAGQYVLSSLIQKTGAINRGLIERTDLTGFNWSQVPSILVECGFMSNAEDDIRLAEPEYRTKLAWGITEGLITYYETV